MGEEPDAREFTRVNVNVDITVKTDEGASNVRGHIRDVSANGVFVATSDSVPVDSECDVIIPLTGEADGPSIRAKGKIVRSAKDGMAIEFVELLGEGSYDHLRRLVMHNAHETKRVKGEFDEHLGIKRLDS